MEEKSSPIEADGYSTDKTTVPEAEEPTISQEKPEPESEAAVGSFVSNKSTEENNTTEGKASVEEDAVVETKDQPDTLDSNRFSEIQQQQEEDGFRHEPVTTQERVEA